MCHIVTLDHYICRCLTYYKIGGCFEWFFTKGFGLGDWIINYSNKRCFALLIANVHEKNFTMKGKMTHFGSTQWQFIDFFLGTNHQDSSPTPLMATPSHICSITNIQLYPNYIIGWICLQLTNIQLCMPKLHHWLDLQCSQ